MPKSWSFKCRECGAEVVVPADRVLPEEVEARCPRCGAVYYTAYVWYDLKRFPCCGEPREGRRVCFKCGIAYL